MLYWKTYECVKLLGALTEDGETFVTSVKDSLTSDVTIQFRPVLQNKNGEHLHVILDNATYFTSKQVADFVEDSAFRITFLPPGSPDMSPVEKCWRQLKRALGNRYVSSLDELRPAIWSALDTVSLPEIYD